MCLHDIIPKSLPQESRKYTTHPRRGRDHQEETHGSCGGREEGMTDTEYQIRDQYQEGTPATSPKPAWFIITSEEIGIICRHLSDIEQDTPAHGTECVREISRILKTVERRLA